MFPNVKAIRLDKESAWIDFLHMMFQGQPILENVGPRPA
jgi:hypothetical protein